MISEKKLHFLKNKCIVFLIWQYLNTIKLNVKYRRMKLKCFYFMGRGTCNEFSGCSAPPLLS